MNDDTDDRDKNEESEIEESEKEEDENLNFEPEEFFQGQTFKHARKVVKKLDDSDDNVKNSWTSPETFNNHTSRMFVGDVGVGKFRVNNGSPITEPSFTLIGNDLFFKYLYEYQQKSGFSCILLREVFYVCTVLFTILFSYFMSACVDWKSVHDGKHTDLKDAIYPMCRPEKGRNTLTTMMFVIFIMWWCIITVRSGVYLNKVWKIKEIWSGVLGLSNDVKWVTWQNVIDRYHERIDGNVDSHYIVNRILRWDNYLNMMISKENVLKFNEIPIIGESAFTKVLEWNLHRSLTAALFRDDEELIKDVMLQSQRMEYVQQLRKTFILYGVLGFIFLPFVLSALTVYFIYTTVGQYHQNPKAMGMFSFTPIAKWKLRDFNELSHVYTSRLNKAHPKILEYLGQFVNEEAAIVFNFLSFVLSATLVILFAVSSFNSDMRLSIWKIEQPIVFYIAVIAASLYFLRTSTVDDVKSMEPEEKYNELVTTLHCEPPSWTSMNTKERYIDIQKMFKYKWVLLLQEIVSVIYVPFIMCFWMPLRAADIVNFMRENSIHVDKLGIICSCANFDESKTDITDLDEDETSTMKYYLGKKMNDSMMNFRTAYPTWDPNRFRRSTMSQMRMNEEFENKSRNNKKTNVQNSNLSFAISDERNKEKQRNFSSSSKDTFVTAPDMENGFMGESSKNGRENEPFLTGNQSASYGTNFGSYGILGNDSFGKDFPLPFSLNLEEDSPATNTTKTTMMHKNKKRMGRIVEIESKEVDNDVD